MTPHWRAAAIVFALLWGGVAIVMHLTDDSVSSPLEVLGLMEEAPWLEQPGLSEERRTAYLDEVLRNYDLLKLPQRSQMRDDEPEIVDRFLKSLTETEINRYLDHTLSPALKIVTEALDKMKPEDRRMLMGRFRRDLGGKGLRESSPDKSPTNEADTPNDSSNPMETLTGLEMETLILTAPTEEKLRLAPMLEDFQARIQGLHR